MVRFPAFHLEPANGEIRLSRNVREELYNFVGVKLGGHGAFTETEFRFGNYRQKWRLSPRKGAHTKVTADWRCSRLKDSREEVADDDSGPVLEPLSRVSFPLRAG